jgi:hypothetical protein
MSLYLLKLQSGVSRWHPLLGVHSSLGWDRNSWVRVQQKCDLSLSGHLRKTKNSHRPSSGSCGCWFDVALPDSLEVGSQGEVLVLLWMTDRCGSSPPQLAWPPSPISAGDAHRPLFPSWVFDLSHQPLMVRDKVTYGLRKEVANTLPSDSALRPMFLSNDKVSMI